MCHSLCALVVWGGAVCARLHKATWLPCGSSGPDKTGMIQSRLGPLHTDPRVGACGHLAERFLGHGFSVCQAGWDTAGTRWAGEGSNSGSSLCRHSALTSSLSRYLLFPALSVLLPAVSVPLFIADYLRDTDYYSNAAFKLQENTEEQLADQFANELFSGDLAVTPSPFPDVMTVLSCSKRPLQKYNLL